MKIWTNLFSFSLLSCLSWAHAQTTASSPPPSPPFVGMLSGDYVLTKKFVPRQQQADPNESQAMRDARQFLAKRAPAPTAYEATETGDLRFIRQSFANGLVVETWRTPGYRLQRYSTFPEIQIVPVDPSDKGDNPTFEELDWITADFYQGEQVYQGQNCFVFKSSGQTAYIAKSNRLPVYFESKTVQVTYTYKRPDEPLQMPDAFKQKIQELVKRVNAAKH